jgi:sterol desaturase/sphingolipid hydroxylase (fatty acid hydroxylase superfamily)
MPLEQWVARTFGDEDPAHFGTGWISGTLSVFLGVLSVFAVLCLRYPGWLVFAEARARYPLPLLRAALELMIGLGFLLGFVSALLRRRRVLAMTGMSAALVAVWLGGAHVPLGDASSSRYYLGLDWFVLSLLVTTSVFVPLERLFPFRSGQGVFRPGWGTDLAHFFVSHLMVQLLTYLTLLPSTLIFAWLTGPALQQAVRSQPLALQLLEILVVADLAEYGIHRLLHASPWLWRFHAVHHSVESMDWLAGSRLHVLDIVLVRGMTFLPVYLLGFSQPAVYAYLLFVSFHAVFIHANVRCRAGVFEHVLALPRFHHWHHSSQAEALDKNFAVHFPWIDQLFGTKHLPQGRWPEHYGVAGCKLPEGWWPQLWWPLRKAEPPPPSP